MAARKPIPLKSILIVAYLVLLNIAPVFFAWYDLQTALIVLISSLIGGYVAERLFLRKNKES